MVLWNAERPAKDACRIPAKKIYINKHLYWEPKVPTLPTLPKVVVLRYL